MKTATPSPEFLQQWDNAVKSIPIAPEVYQNVKIRIVEDESKKSPLKFGITYNSFRDSSSRPQRRGCQLCRVADNARDHPALDLDKKHAVANFVITPNEYPVARGASLAIAKQTGENHGLGYTTKTLDMVRLQADLEELIQYANQRGIGLFHNTSGAGQTEPHEHWQLKEYVTIYGKAGGVFGLDGIAIESTNTRGVCHFPQFPFANLVFSFDVVDRIPHFLKKMADALGSNYPSGSVPHCISHVGKGLVITPIKYIAKKESLCDNFREGFGSGFSIGHATALDENEFAATYEKLMGNLHERLHAKDDFNLEKFL